MTIFEQILVSFGTALATAIFSYFVFLGKIKSEIKKEFENKFNEHKWVVYVDFIKLFSKLHELSILHQVKISENDDSNKHEIQIEIYDELMRIESNMLLISSKNVLKNYYLWKFSYIEDPFAV